MAPNGLGAWCALLLAAPAAASPGPLNIAIGGIQLAPATADLLRVTERPTREGALFQSMEAVRTVTSFASLAEFPLPDVKDSRPVAVKENRLKNSEYLAQGLGEGFEPLRWESVYTARSGRGGAVDAMAEMLREQHRSDPDRPINVVCHSHGCGIALEAFAAVEGDGIRVEKFVSLGTRLTGLPGDNRRDKPANVKDWVNVHSRHDQALSKALDGKGILNVEFTGGDPHPHLGLVGGHALYYRDPEVREAVAGLVNSPEPPEETLRDRYAGVFDLPEPPAPEPRNK